MSPSPRDAGPDARESRRGGAPKRPRVILLGPVDGSPAVGEAVAELRLDGPVATITAGWQEWEHDDEALRSTIEGASWPLSLHERAERIWESDPDFRSAHREMQRNVRLLQHAYRRQLGHAAEAWMELLDTEGPDQLLEPMRRDAVRAIQVLDEAHVARLENVRVEFEHEMRPGDRPAIARERSEIAEILSGCAGVVLEGGHVAVLLNRLRLFGVDSVLADRPLIACAGGAMLLTDRVMLYHDSPAVGRGHAEVGLAGLGLVPDIVLLSDAEGRLRLDDPKRMQRLSLRVAPRRCLTLDPGERLDWDGRTLKARPSHGVAADGTLRLEGAA